MSQRPGGAAFAVLLGWYAATMARGLAWFDAGELALVAYQLGLGHPPGQPLYTMVLAVFARLPGVDPLVGMNLLSALTAAACALPADALLRRFTEATPKVRFLVLLSVGAVAPMWDQGTRIELYGLATLGFLTLLAAGVAAVEARHADRVTWLGLGVMSGLLACVNPVFALGAALTVGLYALPMLGRSTPAAVVSAACGAAIGLLPYLYVYAVHDATDRMVWGELSSWVGVRAYLTGADYAHTAHGAWTEVPAHIAQWLLWLTLEGGAVVLVLATFGWASTMLRPHLLVLVLPALTGAAFVFTYGTAFHPEIPDYNGYLAPAFWVGACGLAVVLSRLAHPPLWAGAVLLATLCLSQRPVWERTRADLDAPRALATAWLESAPPDAVLLVESDHLVFPLMYVQEAEGKRPDVVVFNIGFGASSWFFRHLYRRHPDLPRIELRAPDTRTRVARLIAGTTRAVIAERGDILAALGHRPCARTWGVTTHPCSADADAFAAAISGWRTTDPITRNVLAALAFDRVATLWALGDMSGALTALRDDPSLPVPRGLARPVNAPPLQHLFPVLIGSAHENRLVGKEWLLMTGHAAESGQWYPLDD